jgi:hypothetical protein
MLALPSLALYGARDHCALIFYPDPLGALLGASAGERPNDSTSSRSAPLWP